MTEVYGEFWESTWTDGAPWQNMGRPLSLFFSDILRAYQIIELKFVTNMYDQQLTERMTFHAHSHWSESVCQQNSYSMGLKKNRRRCNTNTTKSHCNESKQTANCNLMIHLLTNKIGTVTLVMPTSVESIHTHSHTWQFTTYIVGCNTWGHSESNGRLFQYSTYALTYYDPKQAYTQ